MVCKQILIYKAMITSAHVPGTNFQSISKFRILAVPKKDNSIPYQTNDNSIFSLQICRRTLSVDPILGVYIVASHVALPFEI